MTKCPCIRKQTKGGSLDVGPQQIIIALLEYNAILIATCHKLLQCYCQDYMISDDVNTWHNINQTLCL